MLSKPVFEYWFRIRSRTFSASSSCLNCSLGLSGSRSPSAHWPSLRLLAGRGDVMRQSPLWSSRLGPRKPPVAVPAAQIRGPAETTGGRVYGIKPDSDSCTHARSRHGDAPPTRCGNWGGRRSLDHCATDVAAHNYQGGISLIVIKTTSRV